MHKIFPRILTAILIFIITACSTATPVPTATLMPTDTPLPPTATLTPSPTLTPTPLPKLIVNEDVNCYAGPSERYDKVASMEEDAEVQVVGQSEDGAFWIVMVEGGGTCWLAKEIATVSVGEVSVLPLVTPQATPTLSPPAAPSELTVTYRCGTLITSNPNTNRKVVYVMPMFILNWQDNANNEDGYIIYKENNEISRTDPNATSYSGGGSGDSLQKTYNGPNESYAVAAFNALGISEKIYITIQLKCPL